MDILDYNRHSSAGRDEHLLVVNGNQSALPSLHHPRIVYCYYPAMSLQLGNFLPTENLELSDHNPMPITHSTRGTEEHLRTTQEFTDIIPQSMDILAYTPRSSGRRDEELLVVNGHQSAIPFLNHPRILDYYATMLQSHSRNIPRPPNMELPVYNPTPITRYTGGRQQHVRTLPEILLQNNRRYEGKWSRKGWLSFVSAYATVCALLAMFIQMKFDKEKKSASKTHLGFIILFIASVFITLASGAVVYTTYTLQSLMKERFSPVFEAILKTLFWFFFTNTFLSLMLLLGPPIHSWTAYVPVLALFLIILAFNFKSLKMSLAATPEYNMGEIEMVQRDENLDS